MVTYMELLTFCLVIIGVVGMMFTILEILISAIALVVAILRIKK